jgi:hypothetical protein
VFVCVDFRKGVTRAPERRSTICTQFGLDDFRSVEIPFNPEDYWHILASKRLK